jgi:hypothetical protein
MRHASKSQKNRDLEMVCMGILHEMWAAMTCQTKMRGSFSVDFCPR